MVPAEGGNAVAFFDAEILERYRQFLCASGKVPIRVAMETVVGKAGDDLFFPEQGLRPSKDGRKGELVFHHQASHIFLIIGLAAKGKDNDKIVIFRV